MIRLFKHDVPNAVLLLGLFDVVLLLVAAEAGWVLRAKQIGMLVEPIAIRWPQLIAFAGAVEIAMVVLVLLLFALPRILVTAPAIKLESRSPAFYRQQRVGLYGVTFDCLKLRSMRTDDLESKLPYYAERHMVKPGITDWAQIDYPFGAWIDDSRQKLERDPYSPRNYSSFLDLLIPLQTIRVVLWPEGARQPRG